MKIFSYPKKLQIKNFINKGLLIFDLDGTIIDSKKDIINSFNFAFKGTLCVKPLSIHSSIEYLGGSTK